MPCSMKKMFSRKSKSCSSLGDSSLGGDISQELSDVFKPLTEGKQSGRRSSGGGKVLGRSVRSLFKRRSSDIWTPVSKDVPTFVLEDSVRTADMSDSNSAWADYGSVTDSSLTLTPPRPQAAAGVSDLVMEEPEEETIENEPSIDVPDKKEKTFEMLEDNIEDDEDVQEESGILELIQQVKEAMEEPQVACEVRDKATEPIVPVPPPMPRREFMTLVQEADVRAEAEAKTELFVETVPEPDEEEEDHVEDEVVHQLLEKRLMVIEESEEMHFVEEQEVDTTSETASESASESAHEAAPEPITAVKVRDSISLPKKIVPKEPSTSSRRGVVSVLAVMTTWVVLVVMLGVIIKSMPLDDFQLSDLELSKANFSGIMVALGRDEVQEAREEVVRQARHVIRAGCKGFYCGFAF